MGGGILKWYGLLRKLFRLRMAAGRESLDLFARWYQIIMGMEGIVELR
jgi:hypothetical protein